MLLHISQNPRKSSTSHLFKIKQKNHSQGQFRSSSQRFRYIRTSEAAATKTSFFHLRHTVHMSGVMSSALCFWLMHSLQSRPRLLFQKYMIATAVLILSECELRNEGTTYMDLSFEDESECGVCTVVGPPHCHRGRGLCRNPRPCFLRLISRPLQLQKRSMSQRAELSLHRCRLHKLCKVHLPCFPLQVSATCNSDSQKRAHDVVLGNQSNKRKAQPRFIIFRSSASNS